MIILSIVLAFVAFSFFACSDAEDKFGGGAVEGNTVVVEYKVDPVQIDSIRMVQGESAVDSPPRESDACEWYELRLDTPREVYYEFYDDIDASEACVVNLYPEQNAIEYVGTSDADISSGGVEWKMSIENIYVVPTENGVAINEKVNNAYFDNTSCEKLIEPYRESCQERGGVFYTPPGGCSCGLKFTCTIELPFLTKPVREFLEDTAERLKNSCMEEVQAYTRH
jgi:hypothetical protein